MTNLGPYRYDRYMLFRYFKILLKNDMTNLDMAITNHMFFQA